MKFNVISGALKEVKGDFLVVGIFESGKWTKEGKDVDSLLQGFLKKTLDEDGFKGRIGNVSVVRTEGKISVKRILVTGLGKEENYSLDSIRKAMGASVKKIWGEVIIPLMGSEIMGVSVRDRASAMVEGCALGSYKFLEYKKEESGKKLEKCFLFLSNQKFEKEVRIGIEFGEIVSSSTNFARDLVSHPASNMTPTVLANVAKKIAKENRLKCKVYDRPEIEKMGMGSFLGVARGSNEPPKFIVLEYRPKGNIKRKIAIVGKGITFDSGGLSIKTASGMERMKDDMSGAAAVLATMRAISKIGPKTGVLGIIAATENMPSGSAMKPGDVIRAMNGKTIEVLNTDAEGRLTLADAISYAVSKKPDEIIDIATLTGGCVIALSRFASGVMGNNQRLIDKILTISKRAGEKMWQLPLLDELKEGLKSDIADVKNSAGSAEGSAIMGGLFLNEFAGDIPWVHIDIAGPAWLEKNHEQPYNPRGATGAGVRTILYYLMEMK